MAEPRAVPGSDAAGSQQDVLLATKLHVPVTLPGFVARPRLAEALDRGLARGVVLVCAPAGFGKTALLADWVRCSGRRVGWLSLDAGDNDPARFWRHAVAALDRVCPGVAERVVPLLGPPPPRSFDGLVAALINEFVTQPGTDDVLLVLDDYHMAESRSVHASLEFLVGHLPPKLHLVLATRADPPLPLARLRGRGQLAELRAAELRFTEEEAASVLREAAGPELPDAAVVALAARTEGWAAGLQLAALSLRGQIDVSSFVATFSGSHRHVLDYLTGEVLDRQPDEVRVFLLETSVLDRLCGPLCDAITARTDGQAMLEQVERANLFLVPLDEVRGWWRYHQLFADLLRARLRQEQPERVPGLHHGAAVWYEQHGLADDAVRHALAAREPTWAARLIEQNVDALLLRSEGATARRWLAALPAELARSRPRLCLAQAQLALDGGGPEAAEPPLEAAERAFAQATADEPFEPSVGPAASLLANIPATIALLRAYLAELRGDAEGTAVFASQTLAEIDEGDWLLASIAQGHLALAEWLRGRLEEAERALSFNVAQWRTAGAPSMAAWGCHYLSQVQRAQGRLPAAAASYQQALEIVSTPGGPLLPVAGIAYVGLAEVAYQRGELEAALRHLAQGLVACRQLIHAQPLATGLATLAWIRQSKGDAAGALEAMAEAQRVAPSPSVTGLLNPVPAQYARLLLAQGNTAAAAGWAQERRLGINDEPSYPREPEHLVLARVLLRQDRPQDALALLERLHTAAATQGRIGSVIELRTLQALALAASGKEADALAVLATALKLSCPPGYVQVFADEGAPMRALIGRLAAVQRTERTAIDGVPWDYLTRLLHALDQDDDLPHAGRRTAEVPGMVEPLTARELEVLQLIATGTTNQRIADELVVTLDTVKKHVSHVLDKLGAANRTQAVIRARQVGLIR